MASTAAMEAKIAASNLYGVRYIRENKGTISAFSTKVFSKAVAATGLTERRAFQDGFSIIVGAFSTMDRHPSSLPGTSKLDLKLIFARNSGVLELNTNQVATHPLLTASLIAYPINAASLAALVQM